MKELRREIGLMVTRYPMLTDSLEKVDFEKNSALTERILHAVLTQSEVVAKDGRILSSILITTVEDELVRGLVLGEIRLLVEKNRETVSSLRKDLETAHIQYFSFPLLCQKIVNSINDKRELRGECEFKKSGSKGPYA